jgi:hypothetical protein
LKEIRNFRGLGLQPLYPVIGYEKDPETKEPDLNKPIHSKTPYGIWKKSDRLLEFLLKGAKPEVYPIAAAWKAQAQ